MIDLVFAVAPLVLELDPRDARCGQEWPEWRVVITGRPDALAVQLEYDPVNKTLVYVPWEDLTVFCNGYEPNQSGG
jgi:hypothetical protein